MNCDVVGRLATAIQAGSHAADFATNISPPPSHRRPASFDVRWPEVASFRRTVTWTRPSGTVLRNDQASWWVIDTKLRPLTLISSSPASSEPFAQCSPKIFTDRAKIRGHRQNWLLCRLPCSASEQVLARQFNCLIFSPDDIVLMYKWFEHQQYLHCLKRVDW